MMALRPSICVIHWLYSAEDVMSDDLPQAVQEWLQLRKPARVNKKQRIFY